MYRTSRSQSIVALLCAFAALCSLPSSSRCEFVVTFSQVGDNVEASGSGTLNLTDLAQETTFFTLAGVSPADGYVEFVPGFVGFSPYYGPISGPGAFGSGGFTFPTTSAGDEVGLNGAAGLLIIPSGYTSGSFLEGTLTFDNTTFSGLGLTPGTYTWTWGTGANADSFEVIVPIPEPSSLILAGTALGVFAFCLGIRRRRAGAVAA